MDLLSLVLGDPTLLALAVQPVDSMNKSAAQWAYAARQDPHSELFQLELFAYLFDLLEDAFELQGLFGQVLWSWPPFIIQPSYKANSVLIDLQSGDVAVRETTAARIEVTRLIHPETPSCLKDPLVL